MAFSSFKVGDVIISVSSSMSGQSKTDAFLAAAATAGFELTPLAVRGCCLLESVLVSELRLRELALEVGKVEALVGVSTAADPRPPRPPRLPAPRPLTDVTG